MHDDDEEQWRNKLKMIEARKSLVEVVGMRFFVLLLSDVA